MKVHLIKERTIRRFVTENIGSRIFFEEWLSKLKKADWAKPSDMLKTLNNADILGKGSNRVVFNIGGNNYRLIGRYAFGNSEVHLFICWVGKHADYDKLCGAGQQYSINHY